MKFKDMKYERPDIEVVKAEMQSHIERLEAANDYKTAREVFLEMEGLDSHVSTMFTLASIRHSIDTRDEFYDKENDFIDAKGPELAEYGVKWAETMLKTPFRKEFEEEYGNVSFINAEIRSRSFKPELIPLMQKENELTSQYGKLIASAQIPFKDGVYTLSQLSPFKTDADDAMRLEAWKAEGNWYKEHQEELDDIYDKLVHIRDEAGKTLGYENYIPLGYDRMQRNCYDKNDVEKFRAAVVKYLVPVAEKIYKRQAEHLGKDYPMSFADNALEFRSGNPRPAGDAEYILKEGDKFYDDLSPETSEFFRTMREGELLDVLSTEGKQGGGYCTGIQDYEVPFIFANFNGTQHDIEVVTHEAGHAFAYWMNRERIPSDCIWPGMEGAEVHSMSMEFFGEHWADGFFGKDAKKFLYSHLASAITFIPYGTMVDHFQHLVYEKPEMTPRERHDTWKELLGTYMPWMRLDNEIPFYADGEGWQRQSHIYERPFYYIDYCLAQTVALGFWAMIQEDRAKAWEHYMAYTKQGGSRVFTELLANAGLKSPFEEDTLRGVCEKAAKYLEEFDLTGIS